MAATTEDIVGRYVKVDGIRAFYDEIGSGIPIVCVHTAGTSSLQYQYILPLLAERGFRAMALDLPGRCRSYPTDWEVPARSLHEHAESVFAFIRTVCGDEKAVVTGASIGGNITLDLVAHHSADLLAAVAMEGAARTPTFPPALEASYPEWAPGWQALLELNAISCVGSSLSPEKVTELRWMHRTGQLTGSGDANGWATHDVRGKLGEIGCPVLVLKGAEDFFLPQALIEETRREMPDAEYRTLEGIGHYPPYEAPELIAEVISDFVETNTTP